MMPYMTGSGGRSVNPSRQTGARAVIRVMEARLPITGTIAGKRKLERRLPTAITDSKPPAYRKLIPASAITDGRTAPITSTAIPLTE